MGKFIDFTGKKIGKLLVLGIDENHKYNTSNKLVWKCQCDCGNICYKTTEELKRENPSGAIKACSQRCGASIPIGTRFGRLVVIENIFTPKKPAKSVCLCDCGKQITVPSNRLKQGGVKSCGCYKIDRMSEIGKNSVQKVDLTGQVFGDLTAIKPTDKRQIKSVVWLCKCKCGNYHLASVNNLKSGSVSHCSECKIHSKGEEKTKQILSQNNIYFEMEKTFESCKNPESNRLLRFDFYVNNKYLIEFDGRQHFISGSGWMTEEKLKENQIRDKIKNEWCKKNNIPLIRIPYTELDFLTLKDLNIETTKFLI